MANTYTLISSNVLTSNAASVTFSSIPATYTDLVLRFSARTDQSGSTWSQVRLTFNGSSAANYSYTYVIGNGASPSSGRDSNDAKIVLPFGAAGASATTDTFSNGEIYIPNYAGSTNKPVSGFTAHETNATTAFITATAGLRSVTDAITSLTLFLDSTFQYVSGSSFYLYGVKNS